ncbi:MAG: DUF4435 domain-containing protein [Bacteroidales bacterium]|nr:DUF4435 domain-containing protein [Bacteroidales bacterium]
MNAIRLPKSLQSGRESTIEDSRQITIIGGNGAGKTRFMEEMMEECGEKAYCLSAISAFYAEREESTRPNSIDAQYRQAVKQRSYMRTDAVSELDKIVYMLFADELDNLLRLKSELMKSGGRNVKMKRSKFDVIKRHWERIFPNNRISREGGTLKFATGSGGDLISALKLSQGEKAVLYYLGATLFAPSDAVIFIDSPTLFVHPSIIGTLWNSIEELRRDCTFVYNSVDEDFIITRTSNKCIWVKRYDSEQHAWDYEVLSSGSLAEDIMVKLAGSRRPVLFIEGDAEHSIDKRLYSLVFPEMTVRPVGSCDKVIETTRSFNDQQAMHHIHSYGIVDRDRRTEKEVAYLRRKQIMVPEVAEIENIFLMTGVIRLMARRKGKDGDRIVEQVQRSVIKMFRKQADEQALQHTRHKMKRDVECKIDGRFRCITALETHVRELEARLKPRMHYNRLRESFAVMIRDNDYDSILKVFNHKPMLPESEVSTLLGFANKDEYIRGVMGVLKRQDEDSERLRQLIRGCLKWDDVTGQSQKGEPEKREEAGRVPNENTPDNNKQGEKY